MPANSSQPPSDPELPGAALLFDTERMARRLEGSGTTPSAVEHLTIRYLEYEPGAALLVHYRADVDGLSTDFLASCSKDSGGAAAGAGSGAVAVTRYPEDPGLALLAEPQRLAALLGRDPGSRSERLAWVPTHRATLALDDLVVKLYGRRQDAELAAQALRLAADLVPTAPLVHADMSHALIAQRRLEGRSLGHADALRETTAAAEMLRALQRIPADTLRPVTAAEFIRTLTKPVTLVAFLRPDLCARLDEVVQALEHTCPVDLPLSVSHGDFNVGQLLRSERGLFVLDLDTLCVAPAAWDVASYATNVVSGRVSDAAEMDRIVDAFGEHSAGIGGLGWYLAAMVVRRIDRPYRRWKRDRDVRCERMLALAERILDGPHV